MGKIIDERVVEMRFDNKKFEQNVKTTMSTLEKLKNALNFTKSTETLKELEDTTKNISLDKIASGVEALSSRFSALGIVGMRVIENITDSLMNRLNNAINFVTNSIVQGGIKRATNIENAHFQLQALLKDEAKVQAVMADAMESVDGTAYAYDEAAKAASQFAASGLQAGEEMLGALKGITGVAAMTNSSFEDISRIFTTVAGNGRLMGDQLLQLSGRGLNAASTIADYFKEVRGQANMTEAEIRDMVSAGKLDFKTFSDAMTWAFGDSAKRANETFTGSLSNMKSALARIGAEFVSPLIEQNSDLIMLFNALRIQINNVKSALAFDEQKSAISGLSKEANLMVETVSRFVMDGTTGFDQFTTAILGAKRNEEELAEINDLLSKSYAELKENGKATTDTFDTFTKTGIDATKAVREYVNGVLDGTIKASQEVKQSVIAITDGTKLLGGDARRLAADGKISYELFTNAIVNYSGAINKGSTLANDALKAMMTQIKKAGSVSRDDLEEFSRNGVSALKSLQEYINGVSDGSIRATYATKQAIQELTQGAKVSVRDITKYAEEGKISYDMFQSALERTYGDQKALSKQFTDFVLDNIKAMVEAVESADLTKPMATFYYGIESVKNVMKGLWTVLKPIGKAFSDVFLGFSGDDVINFAAAIEELTSKMKLSEKGSKNLHDAFEGVFSVVKLLVDGLFKLLGISTSAIEPVGSMTELLLELAGSAGRGLTKFTEWIRQAPVVKTAFDIISKSFTYATSKLNYLITHINEYVEKIYHLPITQQIIKKAMDVFEDMRIVAGKSFDAVIAKIREFRDWLLDLVPKDVEFSLENLSEWISAFMRNLRNSDISFFTDGFTVLAEKMRELMAIARQNEGFDAFMTNLTNFLERMKEAFTLDNLVSNIDTVQNVLGGFVKWIGDILKLFFENVSLGEAFTAGSTVAIIYTFYKAVKSFEGFVGSIKAFPDFLGAVKGVLTEYQKDLKAKAILKIASAIGILALAITVLSFADMKQAWQAAFMLGLVGAALIFSVSALTDAFKKTKTLEDAAFQFAKGLKKALSNIGKAAKYAAFAAAVTSIGASLIMVAGAIIALGIAYRKDPVAMDEAVELVKKIGIVLMAAMGVSSLIGGKISKGASAFAKASLGVIGIAFALSMVVKSLEKLFKMEIPGDWKQKFGILSAIMMELGGLAIVMGIVGKLTSSSTFVSANMATETKAGTIGASPILGFAALLLATVYALEKLFKMEIPSDYGAKLMIFTGIFIGLEAVLLSMGFASKMAEGKMRAGGTILALSVFLFAVVGSLALLANIPGDDILKGVLALDAVLLALSVTLAGAGQIRQNSTAYKAVLAMTIGIAAITASLMFLSYIPGEGLLKGVLALDAVLIALGGVFKQIGTIQGGNESAIAVIAGVIMLAEIAGVLEILSKYSWGSMLSAAIAISAVMYAFGKMLKQVASVDQEFDLKTIGTFLTSLVILAGVTTSLYFLAEQPWEGLLAGAIALSLVLGAFGKSLELIANSEIDPKKAASFLIGTLGVIPIVAALIAVDMLTGGDWASLLASSASIALLIAAIGGIMILMAKFQMNIGAAANAALGFSAFIGIIGAVILAVGALFEYVDGLEGMFQKGIDILVSIGRGIGEFVGAIVGGFKEAAAIGGGGGSSSGSKEPLPSFGQQLTDFMTSAVGFFEGLKNVTPESVDAVKALGAMMLELTASQLLQGIGNALGISGSFKEFGEDLLEFAPSIVAFSEIVKGIDASAVQGAATACEILAASADKLPYDPESWAAKIMGRKSLAEFGQELLDFAPNIVAFATIVEGVKEESVKGAAAACDIMSTCANNLPPDPESWAGKIFGSKTLAEFGQELLDFAPNIVAFATIVEGVKEESVKGAAAACDIMSTCADNLPSQGGLVSKIFGEKNLSVFGAELFAFAEQITGFIEKTNTIDANSIIGVATVTKIMSMLANDIPTTGGFVSLWSGDNSIEDFGKQLTAFGKKFKEFYGYIENILPDKVTGVAASLYSLMEIADIANAGGQTLTSLGTFVDSLDGLGNEGVQKFLNSFIYSKDTIDASVGKFLTDTTESFNESMHQKVLPTASEYGSSFVTKFRQGITDETEPLISQVSSTANNTIQTLVNEIPLDYVKTLGEQIPTSLSDGVGSEEPTVLNTIGNLCNSTIVTLSNGLPADTFSNIGVNVVDSLSNGIDLNSGVAGLSAENMAETVRETLSTGLDASKLEPIGENVANGLSGGINKKIGDIASAAASAANTIINTVSTRLKIESPSKVMYGFGEYADEGLANGILKGLYLISEASETMSTEILSPIQNAVNVITEMMTDGTFDLKPTITPVVDLSDVEAGATEVAHLFNKSLAIPTSYQEALGAATVFEASMRRKQTEKEEKKETKEPVETKVEFNQYNTSPKALSRYDIYRQTNNQLAAYRRAVNRR